MANKWKKYLLWFAQEHVDFRIAEFDSIVKLFNIQHRKISENLLKPFWIVEFPCENTAIKYASRSIALRSVSELLSHATNFPYFHEQLSRYIENHMEQLKTHFQSERSFKITVETYNKHFSQAEKVGKIETFGYLPLEGNVNLKSPDVEWFYIEFWGLDPKEVPDTPEDLLFGRLICNGQRKLIKELSLKQRKFIGNTSMDAQLSLLMANQALVQDSDIVFDPFVGTGSLLVSAAKFGGFVLGADIDFMMLHARSRPSRITQKVREKDESIRANLKQYGCENRYLDVVVSDFSSPIWHNNTRFDCIITDPPYGIREATEKVETKQKGKSDTRTADQPHYPSTSHYELKDLYADLLTFAAKHLKIGGRLVCWVPFHKDDYCDGRLPIHANLEIIANSEQALTALTSRRLLTYEKHSEPPTFDNPQLLKIDEALAKDFRKLYFDNGLESRSERRLRKTEERQRGKLEALSRGKIIHDNKQAKQDLNKARFS